MDTLVLEARGTKQKVDATPSVLAMCIGYFLGYISILALPLWIGGLIETLHLPDGVAGILGTAEMTGVVVGSFSFAFLPRYLPIPHPALFGATVAVAGNALSIWTSDVAVMGVLRFLTGLGLGLIVASAMNAAARSAHPQKNFACMEFSLAALGFVFYLIAGRARVRFGAAGVFCTLSVLLLVFSSALYWLPNVLGPTGPEDKVAPNSSRRPMVLLLAMLALWTATNGLWAYLERIGGSNGVNTEDVSRALAIGSLASMIGPATAAALGVRVGLATPILISSVAIVVSMITLTTTEGAVPFSAATVGLMVALLFVSPYLNAGLAALDPTGRAAAAGPAAISTGSAIGPGVAGLALTVTGYFRLGSLAAALAAGACAVAFMVVRRAHTVTHEP